MKTTIITWGEISAWLDIQQGKQLIGIVTKLAEKFGLSESMANDYVLFYMGYK